MDNNVYNIDNMDNYEDNYTDNSLIMPVYNNVHQYKCLRTDRATLRDVYSPFSRLPKMFCTDPQILPQ